MSSSSLPKHFGAGNQAVLSRILGEDSDANALKDEVAIQATNDESAAITSASAALEVVGLVYAAAAADESVEPVIRTSSPVSIEDIPVSPTDYFDTSSETSSSKNVINGDAEAAALFAAIHSPNPPLSGQPQFDPQNHANGAVGHLSVIPEENDGANQSPLPVGERRAPFTTFTQSPQEFVKDRALRAQPKSPLSNLGSIPPSGQSGTTLTHDFSQSFPQSSFTPADSKPFVPSEEGTGKDVSPQAQSSDNPSGNVTYLPPLNLLASLDPLLPTQSSSSRGHDIGVGDAHFSDNPSKNALSTVGVSRNTHADQPSFPPKSDVGGPPVQVLAKSGKPPGSFGGADHPKPPSRSNLWSSCSQDGTDLSASLPLPNLFGTNGSQVHPLPPTPVNPPSWGTDIGGNPGAHSPGDPHGFVPLPAPSSSSELGSAAATALSPQLCPSGHDIGGIERSKNMLDFDDWYFIALQLMRCGVTRSQVQLFSHLAPKFKVTQGLVVA